MSPAESSPNPNSPATVAATDTDVISSPKTTATVDAKQQPDETPVGTGSRSSPLRNLPNGYQTSSSAFAAPNPLDFYHHHHHSHNGFEHLATTANNAMAAAAAYNYNSKLYPSNPGAPHFTTAATTNGLQLPLHQTSAVNSGPPSTASSSLSSSSSAGSPLVPSSSAQVDY